MNYAKAKTRAKILDTLQESDGWLSVSTVAGRAHTDHKTTRNHLQELANTHAAIEEYQPLLQQHGYEYRYVGLPEWFVDG